MKSKFKCLCTALICMSLLLTCYVNVHAATVDYVKSGNYVYNWGEREETATFLSPMAEAFYEKYQTSYDELITYAGGQGVSNAPSSALYDELQDLMKTAHTYVTSYAATRDLYQYTDCENSGGKISSFYSGKAIGPEWDSGATWNREHTWPNSKGLNGQDENDIMMLRPTSTSENGSRSNTAYGESGGYYHPNSESGGAHDVRGDVSRIFLYVYVRWGNVDGNGEYKAWGTRGVIESLDVLLKWMEEDPVDTWEMGRNDSVQSITGTRNVFVDYPELAFLLFGEEIPSDMTTPSGEAKNSDGSQIAPPTGGEEGGGDSGATTPDEEYKIVEAPEAGVPYKFAMIQQNAGNKVCYLAGGKEQYYMKTTGDVDSAIDVYLEETTGGYYLYMLEGTTKKYINMVVSDTHVNGEYQSNPSTVYRYDEDSKTLVSYITVSADTSKSGDYWFGTRNDKSYETVGPCKTSYDGFICNFYAKDEVVTPPAGDGDEGGTTNPPAGGGDEGGTTNPPADTECNHVYDNDCDASCNLCGETRTVGNHSYNGDCDADCNSCGATREPGSHKYAYFCSTTCKYCGGAEREASHRYIGWQVIEPATAEKPGLERGTCLYCQAVGEREIVWQDPSIETPADPETPVDPETPDEPETPSGDNTDNQNPDTEESDGTVYVVMIVAGATCAVGGAGGAIWFIKKRKH